MLHVNRLKRSNSQDLDDKTDEFKRNGLRSTTGGRLGWSKEVKYVVILIICRHFNHLPYLVTVCVYVHLLE